MTTPIQPPAATSVLLLPLSSALIGVMSALRVLAQRIDAWLATRARAAADRGMLARMSDRELLDIGIDRGSLNSVADGTWRRD
jgi:uncharacterized protein YjiS (DUF1127 family)